MGHARLARLATPALLVVLASTACLAVSGCAALEKAMPWPLARKPETRAKGSAPSPPTPSRPSNAADVVAEALRSQGLQFGTDGSVEALYSYVKARHHMVAATETRVGDIVFFNTSNDREHCGSHAGVVEGVRTGGAISFREHRAGQLRRSVVDPERPTTRRDESGRIINTYLRPKHPDDPAHTRYFAGQMLCAVARIAATR